MSLTNPAYFAYVTNLLHTLPLSLTAPETRLTLYAYAVLKFPELNNNSEAIQEFSQAMTVAIEAKKRPKVTLSLKTSS